MTDVHIIHTPFPRKRMRDEIVDWIAFEQFLHPTAVTLTLKQALCMDGEYMRIDDYSATQNLRDFLNKLNKKVFRNAAARYGKQLKCISIRENDDHHRMHYHLLLDRPERMSDTEYECLVRTTWMSTLWAKPQMHYQPNVDTGWLDYMTKYRTKKAYSDAIDWTNCSL
jgi:plasmid rolling circle replication initiator protein Rep